MREYFLALDLQPEPSLIAEYEAWHQNVWPEIRTSISESGIVACDIYRVHNRLVMHLKTTDEFSFEHKASMDASNLKVQEWETLMWKYQQQIPGSKPGEKWQLMENIFSL